jgi:hypothetical protein
MKYTICDQYKTCKQDCPNKKLNNVYKFNELNIDIWNSNPICNANIKRQHIIFISEFQFKMWEASRRNK